MPAGFALILLADPRLPELGTMSAASRRTGIGGHGCELYGRELPRFGNSRNVEMTALPHLVIALTLRLQL